MLPFPRAPGKSILDWVTETLGIHCLTVLEVRSQKGAKVKVSAFLLEALVKNLFSYLFQIQAPTHIPCPVVG